MRTINKLFNQLGLIVKCVAFIVQPYYYYGDFETGGLEPWTCSGAKCEILDETNYLAITERKVDWSGPRQFLPVEGFTSNDDLNVAFNFSIRSPETITANWKVKVTKSAGTKCFVIYTVDISDNSYFQTFFFYLTLPNCILP